MKISIVIPIYNVEQYIEDCLKSVAAQTYEGEMECIIIDDCTPDNSCVIIERFISEHKEGNISYTLLHHSENRGLSAARNTGIDAATGDYIYFLDSDDEITPKCIELLVEPLKNKKYDFVIGNYETIETDTEFPPLLLKDNTLFQKDEIRNLYFANQWYVMAWNKLCNLKFIRNNKLYFKEGLIYEDELWSFKLACITQTMYCVRKNTYKYKIRPSSIMSTSKSAQRADNISVIISEVYNFSKEIGKLYDYNLFKKLLSFREIVLSLIFSQNTYKERKNLYIKNYKKIRIKPWEAYKNNTIRKASLIKEFYNYLPGILGYWYLCLYRNFRKNAYK